MYISNFRIYQGALTQYQVSSLSSFNLNAVSSNGNIYLFWYGFANSSSFTIQRGTASGGPYTVVAANVANQLSYTDSGLAAGTYYYVAVAGGVTSNQVKVIMSNPVVVNTYLTFDQTSGTVAVDSSGNGNNASLVNNATFIQGYINNAVLLDNNNSTNGTGYVSLPTGFYDNLADFSITAWVNINNLTNRMRVFDFGYGTQRSFMFTPSNANGVATFSISLNGFNQSISANNALPTQQWVHLAVTLSGTTGIFYVNGKLWAQGAIQIAPYQIAAGMSGITANNWIGRSQSSAPVGSDPYFDGLIDDFRIYSAALPANTILNLAQFSEMDTYLTFGQVNGTLVLDQSGNQNHGQLVGNANITTGIVNSSVSLDGSSGYVLLPSNLIINSLDFTIAAWVSHVEKFYIDIHEPVRGKEDPFRRGVPSFLNSQTQKPSRSENQPILEKGKKQLASGGIRTAFGLWSLGWKFHHVDHTFFGLRGRPRITSVSFWDFLTPPS